jgi:hypothetical protein
MKNGILLSLFIVFSFCTSHAQTGYKISGTVKDQNSAVVPGAKIVLTDKTDPTKIYTAYSDVAGNYTLTISAVVGQTWYEYSNTKKVLKDKLVFLQSQPNPFSYSVSLPVYLAESTDINLSVFSTSGQLVCQVASGIYPKGITVFNWNRSATNQGNIQQGLYLAVLRSKTEIHVQKLISLTNSQNLTPSVYTPDPTQYTLKGSYGATSLQAIVSGTALTSVSTSIVVKNDTTVNFILNQQTLPYVCIDNAIGIFDQTQNKYNPLFIKGINLGVATPGNSPGQIMDVPAAAYQRWLTGIGQVGFNVIRVYTLHSPLFYEELYKYNTAHPDAPIMIIQGVWLDDDDAGLVTRNLVKRTSQIDEEIGYVIDAVHGNKTILARAGKAYGVYTKDVSRYVLGYLLGREIDPIEVDSTNLQNPAHTSFSGRAFSVSNVKATEVFETGRMDTVVSYERLKYKNQRPVAFSSWPTLDPIKHPTEPPPPDSYEDFSSVDLSGVKAVSAPAGFYVSFHAYPYYPNFMTDDPGYRQFADAMGPNSYIGYLQDLKNYYGKIPVLIAETGVPSSWGNAHYAYTQMHHGDHSEAEQGTFDVRIMNNIKKVGLAGGILFEWMDEWFKRTWIVQNILESSVNREFWQNLMSPERNFGLIGFQLPTPAPLHDLNLNDANISSVKVSTEPASYNVAVNLNSAFVPNKTMVIGFDTYRSDLGESILPDGSVTSNRAEFALKITSDANGKIDSAKLYVTEAYDLNGYSVKFNTITSAQKLHSTLTDGKPWKLMQWRNGNGPTDIQNIGVLGVRNDSATKSSLDAVVLSQDGKTISIRIPWTLLQVYDPTKQQVVSRYYLNDIINESNLLQASEVTTGIAISLFYNGSKLNGQRVLWDGTQWAGSAVEYNKDCLPIITNGLKGL